MQRVAFSFKIKPELKAGYKKAHDEIWPELAQEITKHGIKNYSIFFRPDGQLFGYLESEGDFKEASQKMAKLEVSKKWQEYMDEYFVKEDDSIVGPEMVELEEVFHIN
jgi:L-rhamnose mutarotase